MVLQPNSDNKPDLCVQDEKSVDDGSVSSDHDISTEYDQGDSATSGHNVDTSYTKAAKEIQHSVKKQDQGVFCWRIIVQGIMLVSAIALTIATYVQLSRSEQTAYQTEFDHYSKSIIDEVNFDFDLLTDSVTAFSHLITLYALTSSQIPGKSWWPHVTILQSQLADYGEHVISLSSNNFFWITPIIYDVTKWNDYRLTVKDETDVPTIPFIFNDNAYHPVNGTGPFTPIHQVFCVNCSDGDTATYASMINYDMSSDNGIKNALVSSATTNVSTLSSFISFSLIRDTYPKIFDPIEPVSMFVEPFYNTFNKTEIVGYIQSLVEWKYFFSAFNINWASTLLVISIVNTCGDVAFLKVSKDMVVFIGLDEFKKLRRNDIHVSTILSDKDYSSIGLQAAKDAGVCIYTMTIHPTQDYRNQFNTHAGFYTSIVGITMLVMVGSFLFFDHYVRHRNAIVLKSAAQSSAIVSSMFPSNVRDRLYKEQEIFEIKHKQHGNLKALLHHGDGLDGTMNKDSGAKPLADLFPETTVLFADVAGFTAWSSIREPCQVFVLLESLYAVFDTIAKRNRIFKVETIGDCYVAVSGLPEAREDHAIAMCKFSVAILKAMHRLTKQMETTLGPDTGDLALRLGLHSGPVTAGVLRGDRARFQLFGDTMNTAARMEQTGIKNKIQISQTTADSIIAGGKSHWLRMREDKVVAKGKGELTTYWLEMNSDKSGRQSSHSSESGSANHTDSDEHLPQNQTNQNTNVLSSKMERLVDWNVDILRRLILEILINRCDKVGDLTSIQDDYSIGSFVHNKGTAFDEVKETISVAKERKVKLSSESSKIDVSPEVMDQLRKYIYQIALMYKNNPFHNFEHASHVTMSVSKLLSRIVEPTNVQDNDDEADHSYGITSDPLIQFSCIFSALIHDVDHSGVTNAQLVIENIDLAERYGGRSVAEQNSIDVAWNLFLQEEYKDFRCAICSTKDELLRFRQLVINIVMATDIMDKDLKQLREARWLKAFHNDATETIVSTEEVLDHVNRKATIVIEHLIQASDVSHTMQHWHIYRKWNDRFFWECYNAYEAGRSMINPLDTWYQGELGFFDYYIIPLAKKLEECGVFGVSSAEYLQYAINNRTEWEARGVTIVAELHEAIKRRHATIEHAGM